MKRKQKVDLVDAADIATTKTKTVRSEVTPPVNRGTVPAGQKKTRQGASQLPLFALPVSPRRHQRVFMEPTFGTCQGETDGWDTPRTAHRGANVEKGRTDGRDAPRFPLCALSKPDAFLYSLPVCPALFAAIHLLSPFTPPNKHTHTPSLRPFPLPKTSIIIQIPSDASPSSLSPPSPLIWSAW